MVHGLGLHSSCVRADFITARAERSAVSALDRGIIAGIELTVLVECAQLKADTQEVALDGCGSVRGRGRDGNIYGLGG